MQIIVDSILSIRTQFSMALDSARLYVFISQEYITPCLGEMSKLKVSASPEKQEEMKEKLATFTAQMSEEITKKIKEVGSHALVLLSQLADCYSNLRHCINRSVRGSKKLKKSRENWVCLNSPTSNARRLRQESKKRRPR